MGLFSRKAKTVSGNTGALSQAELWMKTVTDEEIDEIRKNLIARIDNLPCVKEEIRGTSKARKMLNIYFDKVARIDRQATMSKMDISYLYNELHAVLPKNISDTETEIYEGFGIKSAKLDLAENITMTFSRVDSLPQVVAPSRKTSALEVSKKTVQLDNELADAKLKQIQGLIATASDCAVTVEDRFTVEQAGSSYVPEAIRLYSGLRNTTGETQAEATDLFVKQLDLVARQLETIIRSGSAASLDAMRAHTQFLEEKAKPGPLEIA